MKKNKFKVDLGNGMTGDCAGITESKVGEFEGVDFVEDKSLGAGEFQLRMRPKYAGMFNCLEKMSGGMFGDMEKSMYDWMNKIVELKELSIRTYLEKVCGYDIERIMSSPLMVREMELSKILATHKMEDVYNDLTGENTVCIDGFEVFHLSSFKDGQCKIRHVEFEKKNKWRKCTNRVK